MKSSCSSRKTSVAECRTWCEKSERCVAYTYYADIHRCVPKVRETKTLFTRYGLKLSRSFLMLEWGSYFLAILYIITVFWITRAMRNWSLGSKYLWSALNFHLLCGIPVYFHFTYLFETIFQLRLPTVIIHIFRTKVDGRKFSWKEYTLDCRTVKTWMKTLNTKEVIWSLRVLHEKCCKLHYTLKEIETKLQTRNAAK